MDALPPHSDEAEQGVLGCILLDPTCITECVERFRGKQDVFFDVKHRTIYLAMMELHDDPKGGAIDLVTLLTKLREMGSLENVGGVAFLSELPDKTPSAANLQHYLDIVWEKYSLRTTIQVGRMMATRALEEDTPALTIAEDAAQSLTQIESSKTLIFDAKASTKMMINDLEARSERHQSGKMTGYKTGFWFYDKLTDGLQPGEQVVIGARPSMGKTSFGLQIAGYTAIECDIPTAFVTLEMGVESIMRRIACQRLRIDSSSMRKGVFTEREWSKLAAFSGIIRQKPLYIIDNTGGANVSEVCAHIRRCVRQYGIKIVIIDYLQKIEASRRNEKKTYEVAEVSSKLRSLAVREKLAMLTMAQLNRESERDPKKLPRLGDLSDSGQIEKDGDVIGLIHRERMSDDQSAKLVIAKNRDGATSVVDMVYDGQYFSFSIVQHEHQP